MSFNLLRVYQQLYKQLGPQHWWPTVSANREFEIMVGAILTQNTNWQNAEKAIANLVKAKVLSSKRMLQLPMVRLQQLIRPAGYYRQKAKKLKIFCRFLRPGQSARKTDKVLFKELKKLPSPVLRSRLLALWGIGPETADSILLYALAKPVFVVDAYTLRYCRQVLKRNFKSYNSCQQFFITHLPKSVKTYKEFHALIVRWGKN